MVLSDHERCANRADGQAEEQKCFVVVSEAYAHHRQRPEEEQPGVRPARTDAITKKSHEGSDDDGDGYRGDRQVADLRFREVKLLADDRHQWRKPEPSKKTDEEREPREVEGAHGSAGKVGESYTSGFVF